MAIKYSIVAIKYSIVAIKYSIVAIPRGMNMSSMVVFVGEIVLDNFPNRIRYFIGSNFNTIVTYIT